MIHDKSIYTNADGSRKFRLEVISGNHEEIIVVDQDFNERKQPYTVIEELIETKKLILIHPGYRHFTL